MGGVQGYLEGIFGDPSLTKILGKTKKNVRKTKKNPRTTSKTEEIRKGRIWGGVRDI